MVARGIRRNSRQVRSGRQLRSVLVLFLLACGGGTSEPQPGTSTITLLQGQDQQATVAMLVASAPLVELKDGAGRPIAGSRVTFTVAAGGGWTVSSAVDTDAQGRASTPWYLGPRPGEHRLTISSAAGSVEVRATATALQPGQAYFGVNQWMEFLPGDLPLILSAPHGGTVQPTSIPDRTGSDVTTVRDSNTEELAREIRSVFQARTGKRPFVIICRLHRLKLDANREIGEAAKGNALAERAWREYHGFIEAAQARVVDTFTRGFYIDLHGHGHPIGRLELGYLLTANELAGSDASLNAAALVQKSSIRSLVQSSAQSHATLLRGPQSLGALFQAQGVRAVPSPTEPDPAGEPYFNGGYNTARYGSSSGGAISGVQIESHFTGVRDNATSRTNFAHALVTVLNEYFVTFYGAPLAAVTAPAASFALSH